MLRTFRAAAAAALLLFALPAAAQKPAPAATPAPKPAASPAGPVKADAKTIQGATPAGPAGSRQAEVEDLRLLTGATKDPYQLERFGVAAVQKGELDMARQFFEQSWKVGELPTAPYNLACLDARAGKADEAFRQLDRAVGAGFDEEAILLSDHDLDSLRGSPRFGTVLAGVRKNKVDGDRAVVTEATVVPPPGGKPAGILVVLHGVASDPMSVAGPFVEEARARNLLLFAPRGPARAGKRRFGWGAPERAVAALESAVAAAEKRAGGKDLPVFIVGAGRGGQLGLEFTARKPGPWAGVASIGGVYDPGPGGANAVQGLRRVRILMGAGREAPAELIRAMKQGTEDMKRLGLDVRWAEWPGSGDGLPDNAKAAARDVLNALAGSRGA